MAELTITKPLADTGLAWAQAFLGDSYRNGEGVLQDYAEVVKCEENSCRCNAFAGSLWAPSGSAPSTSHYCFEEDAGLIYIVPRHRT